MSVEELLIYFLIVLTATLIGIPLGSWINSKLLTRTFKGEIKKTIKESKEGAVQSPEYKTAVELLNNLNDLLKSPEAKNFFQNATKLLNEIRTQLIQPPTNPADQKPLIILPEKPKPQKPAD